MPAVCDWCLSIIEKPPENYDPKKNILYCSPACYQLDWMFKRWQNDKYLEWNARKYMEGNDDEDP